MDGSTFDTWTRRRFGLAISGASLFGVVDRFSAGAKGKKKVRCRKEPQTCDPNDKAKRCCSGLNCDVYQQELRCCRGLRNTCTPGTDTHCCGDLGCAPVSQLSGNRCCALGGDPCAGDEDCCFDVPCSSGHCEFVSDRALKTNFGTVDPSDVLARVRELPISTWNYTSDDPAVRHIGPMAQDFAALFGVGGDDRHIHPLDGQGVALAAIQALAVELERLRGENARLMDRIGCLERGEN